MRAREGFPTIYEYPRSFSFGIREEAHCNIITHGVVRWFDVAVQEARCMVKARKAGVETPCLYLIDSSNSKIYMEKVDGVTAKQFFLDCLQRETAAYLAQQDRRTVQYSSTFTTQI